MVSYYDAFLLLKYLVFRGETWQKHSWWSGQTIFSCKFPLFRLLRFSNRVKDENQWFNWNWKYWYLVLMQLQWEDKICMISKFWG